MTIAVSAILLAAGESSRMGTQKALLPWNGSTLIEYQLSQLAGLATIRETIVVTGHQPEQLTEIAARTGVRLVHNANYAAGKVSSILAGMHAVDPQTDAILLLAVDQPRKADLLRQIIDQHDASGSLITVPTHKGRRGHPPVFSRALRTELLSITEGTQGIRRIMQDHAGEIGEVECDASVLIDLNEPADLANRSHALP